MDVSKKVNLVSEGMIEVISEDELKELVVKKDPIVYIGYEPSGKIHLGHALTILKLISLQELGFKVKVLLADYHAFLNGKGSLDEIKEIAEYNEKCFRALGLSNDTEFVYGSDFQTRAEYTNSMYSLAVLTTVVRANRSMALIARDSNDQKVAELIYPLMQVADMVYLDVDLAIGGMEQRKIHMLARDNLPKIGRNAPVCMHLPLLHGTDGSDKMSSSKGNFIAVDDSVDEIRSKLKKCYCPIGVVKNNPIIEIIENFVFPYHDKLLITRPEKFGGNLELDHDSLIETYENGEVHPLDIKNAIADYLIDFFAGVRADLN